MISPERSHELLRAYVATRCGTAFRELVAGWTGMVHATALRVARGQEALAEDVTQTVFSRLAAAPEKVKDARALGAWLHAAATGFTLDALRLEARRRRREEVSQDLNFMHTPELPTPDAGDGGHELTPEIDGALSKLPPQDSQLLMMRFWQQQDWRSIGRNFGLSDDAAQKRMNRALERLRRILARRGITSTAGVLTAVLAGTVPRDLPAATVLKIISAAQVSTATASGAVSTTMTTVAMTTKTKIAIAAVLVITASAPFIYRQRISALEAESRSRQTRVAVPSLKKTPAAALAEEGAGSVKAIRSKAADLPDASSPERHGLSGPVSDEGGPPDIEALKRGQMKEKVAVLRDRLSLTPEQETKIAQALEYGQINFKISPPNVIPIKPTPEDLKKMEDTISASLTADQEEEYASFRAEEKANALEAVANRELSRLQFMLTLSPEQKDQAFAAFSDIALRESTLPVLDPEREADAIRATEKARWADRQEALGAILTPEQMALYQQSGNPFHRGSGG